MAGIAAQGRTLPMLPTPRPVDPEWRCQGAGDCCELPEEVVMTREERQAILPKIPQGIKTAWRELENGMVALKAKPCPFHIFKRCVVYEVRPYNCRRFACMRPDPKTEPFESGGVMGCKNLEDRVKTSRIALRLAQTIQRRAMRWARQHGWKEA